MPFGLKEDSSPEAREYLIESFNLVKSYKKRESTGSAFKDLFFPAFQSFRAVDDVSLHIKKGEIFGLLGPNGAGKTTLIKMLTGLLAPNSGRVVINGRPTEEAMKKIGVMFGFSMIYHRLTGYDNLRFFGELYKVENIDARIKLLSEFLGIGPWLNSYVEHYSSGMMSKLALARALIHDPEIVFLDEPTLGLDPKISLQIRKQIKEMKKTIIITTHYMEEANELCDRIGIINHGKLIRVDTPANLKKLVEKNVAVTIGLAFFGNELLNELRGEEYIHNIELTENGLRLLLEHKRFLPELLSFLSKYKIVNIVEEQPTLVDVFLRLTTEPAAETEGF